jgi:hypothetical protein
MLRFFKLAKPLSVFSISVAGGDPIHFRGNG